jgi:hypothetical protein
VDCRFAAVAGPHFAAVAVAIAFTVYVLAFV